MACWGDKVETSVNSEILESGVSCQGKELASGKDTDVRMVEAHV
jgi:hypothetical protein